MDQDFSYRATSIGYLGNTASGGMYLICNGEEMIQEERETPEE